MGALQKFEYDYETISKLSGWQENTVAQAHARGEMQISNLGSVAIWLAGNGKPKIRAEMARLLLPAIFGLEKRRLKDSQALGNVVGSIDLLLQFFEREDKSRRARSKKISKTKGSNGRH